MFLSASQRHIFAKLIKQYHNINKTEHVFIIPVFLPCRTSPALLRQTSHNFHKTYCMSQQTFPAWPRGILLRPATDCKIFRIPCLSSYFRFYHTGKVGYNRKKKQAFFVSEQEKVQIFCWIFSFCSFLMCFSCDSSDFLVYNAFVLRILLRFIKLIAPWTTFP